jgi:hypothetical protein
MKFYYWFHISSYWFMQMYFIYFHHIVLLLFKDALLSQSNTNSTLATSLDTNNIVWIFFSKISTKKFKEPKFVKENRDLKKLF